MSFWRKKEKGKDHDSSNGDAKPAKPKKVKANDIWAACAAGSVESLEKVIAKKGGTAQINAPDDEGRSPIHIAAGAGHVPVVEVLLSHGAHCNMIENTEQRWNVLHWAVQSRNFAMMKLVASQANLKRTPYARIILRQEEVSNSAKSTN